MPACRDSSVGVGGACIPPGRSRCLNVCNPPTGREASGNATCVTCVLDVENDAKRKVHPGSAVFEISRQQKGSVNSAWVDRGSRSKEVSFGTYPRFLGGLLATERSVITVLLALCGNGGASDAGEAKEGALWRLRRGYGWGGGPGAMQVPKQSYPRGMSSRLCAFAIWFACACQSTHHYTPLHICTPTHQIRSLEAGEIRKTGGNWELSATHWDSSTDV